MTPADVFTAARREMAGPFVRGERDCLTTACRTSERLFGRDPLASYRPDYRTLTGAMRIGRWLERADRTFTASGMRRVANAKSGDLCVIVPNDAHRDGLTFAVCVQDGEYVEKGRDGLRVQSGRLMGAWRWV